MQATINPETGTKYSREELLDAFNMVCNKANWKMPIHGEMIDKRDIDITREAIIFFTGSVPTFTQPFNNGFESQVIVKAAGYYAVCGA